MYYKSRIYQLNSLRLGLVHEDNIYGKATIFLAMGSQSSDTEACKAIVDWYKDLHIKDEFNLIAIPFDNNGSEPGDDYEIVSHYENVLGIKFYVTEKLDASHQFFKDFGVPTNDFTEYHFDAETKFMRKI